MLQFGDQNRANRRQICVYHVVSNNKQIPESLTMWLLTEQECINIDIRIWQICQCGIISWTEVSPTMFNTGSEHSLDQEVRSSSDSKTATLIHP